MQVKATCKFCKKPLSLEISDDYAALKDPLNLIPLASCNHCADVRTEHRKLFEAIQQVCLNFDRSPKKEEAKETTRRSLLALTKAYAAVIESWIGLKEKIWEEAMIEPFLSKPSNFGDHLKMLWQTARQQKTLL